MRVTNVRISFFILSLLVLSGALPGLGSHGGFGTLAALAATPQQKAEARTYLNQVTASLRSVDTAYASGNAAEAQSSTKKPGPTGIKLLRQSRHARRANSNFCSIPSARS